MPQACAPPDAPGLVSGLLADTDCQAFGLVERGYAALPRRKAQLARL